MNQLEKSSTYTGRQTWREQEGSGSSVWSLVDQSYKAVIYVNVKKRDIAKQRQSFLWCFFFFKYFLATSMTNWALIFTGLLFYAYVGIHHGGTPSENAGLWQLPNLSSAFISPLSHVTFIIIWTFFQLFCKISQQEYQHILKQVVSLAIVGL